MEKLLEQFNKEYDFIYDAEERGSYVAGYDEALEYGDELIRSGADIVGKFVNYRGDFLSSDREVVAFAFALDALNIA
jgi:hypothetical protein